MKHALMKFFSLPERLFRESPMPDLDTRLNTILPEQYQNVFEEIEPVSMGTASLKYDDSGQVAWDQVWGSFCNLAMAGGPPHKGTLLEPGSAEEIAADPERYREVAAEACRGVQLASGLLTAESPMPGWIQVFCETETMAEWMQRAIVVENVLARCVGVRVLLPVGPRYRVAKEIKNVVTVVAKTSHYWMGHVPPRQRSRIGNLFLRMNATWPLLSPGGEMGSALAERIAAGVRARTGLEATAKDGCAGWVGYECPDIGAAVWQMRALVATNVLARREERTVFVPVDAGADPEGASIVGRVGDVSESWRARGR